MPENTQLSSDSLAASKTISARYIHESQQDPSDLKARTDTPDYLESVYHWSYLNPRNVRWLDQEWVVKIILWWQHAKLREAAFCEIQRGEKVVQTAAVYGIFSTKLAEHIGLEGELTVLDVAPIQASITQKKLSEHLHTKVVLSDASAYQITTEPDVILSYFLLHEVPDDYKQKILDNLLSQLPLGSKLVLVDYHKPHWAHPLKPLMSLVFTTLEPFAKAFWDKEISDFSQMNNQFHWQKSTFFGGMYQKVVVTRKQ